MESSNAEDTLSSIDRMFEASDKEAYLLGIPDDHLIQMVEKMRNPPFLSKEATKETQQQIIKSISAILKRVEKDKIALVNCSEEVLRYRDLAHLCENTSIFYLNLMLELRKYMGLIPLGSGLEYINLVTGQSKKQYVNTGEELGRGGFGKVFKGFSIPEGHLVAIKAIEWTNILKSTKRLEYLHREVDITPRSDHPNVVRLLDQQSDDLHYFLILEYCGGGTMREFIRTNKYNQMTVWELANQIARGLHYLKEQNIIHRDLKASNILMAKDKEGKLIAKIADFGLARFLKPNERANTFCGSSRYAAPELIRLQPYTDKCDLWSIGCIFYELAYGRHPFTTASEKELLENIFKPVELSDDLLNHDNSPLSPDYVKQMKALIKHLLVPDPVNRIGWEEFFNHPFFRISPKMIKRITITTPSMDKKHINDNQERKDQLMVAKLEQKMIEMEKAHRDEIQKLIIKQENDEKLISQLDHGLKEKEEQWRQREEELVQQIELIRKHKHDAENEAKKCQQITEETQRKYNLALNDCAALMTELSDLKWKLKTCSM